MKKFVKGVCIVAGVFLIVGILLGAIGLIAARYTDEKYGKEGLFFIYDVVDFDENHDIVYGSFADDSLQGENVRKLDLEIGGGTLLIQKGNGMSFQKDGGTECQYYIDEDTFYIKQKCPTGDGEAGLTLTLPEDILLEEVYINMAAGQIITTGLLTAEKVEVKMAAGELTMEEVKADSFSADVAAGAITLRRLDTVECDTSVRMGSITLQDGLITGNLDASVSMGEISVFLRDSYENHSYNVSCGMGEVEITTEKGENRGFSGIGGNAELIGKNAIGNSLYDLNCSMGSIYMGFLGEQKM